MGTPDGIKRDNLSSRFSDSTESSEFDRAQHENPPGVSSRGRNTNSETTVQLREIAAHLVEVLIEGTSVQEGLSRFARDLTDELQVEMVALSALGTNAHGNYQMFGFREGVGTLNYELDLTQIPVRSLVGENFTGTVISDASKLEKYRAEFPRLDRLLDDGMVQFTTTPLRWRGENVGWISKWGTSASSDPQVLVENLDELASNVSSAVGYIQLNQRM